MQKSFKSASESSLLNIYLDYDYTKYIEEYITNQNFKMVDFIINTYHNQIQWDLNLFQKLLTQNYLFNIKKTIKNVPTHILEKLLIKKKTIVLQFSEYKEILLNELLDRLKTECIQNDDPLIFLKIIQLDHKTVDCPVFRKIIQDKQLPNLLSFYDNLSCDNNFFLDNEIYELIKNISLESLDVYFDKHNSLLNLRDRYKNNLLHYSVIDNNYTLVEYFLKRKININDKNVWFLTPLNEAVRLGYHNIANLLRENGAFLQNISDSKQSIIGIRQDFFNKLEFIVSSVVEIFNTDFVFQLFHSVLDNTHLYNCSLAYYAPTMTDFYETSMHFVFDKNNSIFFKETINIIYNCNTISQQQFFMSPLCKDYNIHSLITFPFIIGKTFLGYFFIWAKEYISNDSIQKFSSFINYFMESDYTKCILLFPHLYDKIFSFEKCLTFYIQNMKNLESQHSRKFSNALNHIVPLMDFSHFQFYDCSVLNTLYNCHIPFTKISSKCLQDLSTIVSLHPSDITIPSHLFIQMTEIQYNEDNLHLEPIWDKHHGLVLTSLDLYEIIGSHHDISYKSRLNDINELILSSNTHPESIFQKCVKIISESDEINYRNVPVLGLEIMDHYLIFLPHYEIENGIRHIFDTFSENYIPTISDIYLACVKLLEWVHPFIDGNGRTVRLFITIYLRSHGIPIIYEYRPINSLAHFILSLKKIIQHKNVIKL